MDTKIIEATQHAEGGMVNHGKFMLMRFSEDEWEYRSRMPVPGSTPSRLLSGVCGWGREHAWVLDLQTGEGACFRAGGYAKADLDKHAVWVCPMFEPFLEHAWQWAKDGNDIFDLPELVELPDAGFAMYGYRRRGPEVRLADYAEALDRARATLADEDSDEPDRYYAALDFLVAALTGGPVAS